MKTSITRILILGGMALLTMESCKKNDALVTTTGGMPGTVSANTTTPVLNKANAGDTSSVFTITTTPPKYDYSAAASITIQIDSVGDNWQKPTNIALGAKSYSLSYTTAALNEMLLKKNFAPGKTANLNVRVEYALSSTMIKYSNVLSVSTVPYSLVSYVWVPGTYQNSSSSLQWSPATADSLVSPTSNGVFTGYIYFQGNDQFKITPARNWNSSYGSSGTGKISLTGGNIIGPATKGLYFVTVNISEGTTGTISWTSADHSWSIIGDAAIDWSTDVPMTFNQNDNAYEVTTALKTTGGYKFRADAAWSLSYGLTNPVNGNFLTSSGGGNINPPTVIGTYLVSFSFGDPLNGPFYKAVKQ